jgi:orotate phosphoribosyltransferase
MESVFTANADIEGRRRRLCALITDPANGFIVSLASGLVPAQVQPSRYIDFDKLVRNPAVFSEFSDVLEWDAQQIHRETPYDEIVAVDEATTQFAREVWSRSRFIPRSLIHTGPGRVNQAFSDANMLLRGRRCLVVTDVILVGRVVEQFIAFLRHIGATPVAILAAIQVASSSHPPTRAGGDLPIHSATRINTDAFSTAPETLYARDADLQKAVPIITDVDTEIVKYFARHPDELYKITPRTFEKLVAHIIRDFGHDVELTQATRDGGTDIIAYVRTALTSFLVRIECKRFAPEHKVDIDIVRSVLGVQELVGASKSIIVTTSYFTRVAAETARTVAHRLELKDYTDLKAWLSRYR